MKHTNIIFSLLLVFGYFAGLAEDLSYKWKAGSIYRFQAVQKDDISMSVNMMGVNSAQKDIYTTDLVFALKVAAVRPDGTADALLYVEQFKVTNKAGKLVASMAGIPKEALSSPVEVTRKGKFTYKKMVYMIVQDNTTLVVTGKAEQNKVSASSTSPDGTTISVNAEFDPKTGTLKAGYTVANVGKPKTKTVKVKEDAKELDLLPYSFLEMLSLPEGDIKTGQILKSSAAGVDMTVKAESIVAPNANISFTFTQDLSKVSDTKSSVQSDDTEGNKMDFNQDMSNPSMNGMPNMNGMPDMGNMGMPSDMQMSPQEKGMMPEQTMDGKINSTFDITKGMFKTLNGTINSSTKTMGMNTTVKSVLTLKAL